MMLSRLSLYLHISLQEWSCDIFCIRIFCGFNNSITSIYRYCPILSV